MDKSENIASCTLYEKPCPEAKEKENTEMILFKTDPAEECVDWLKSYGNGTMNMTGDPAVQRAIFGSGGENMLNLYKTRELDQVFTKQHTTEVISILMYP